ncbi:MAG: homospermidine synthase [Alphaproteobacteria bacterium]|nr:homospermidine synthase [Alphaproteobacteria bacterium]
MTQKWPVYGKIDGPVIILGFGSIGRGVLPLILRHFECDRSRMVVIAPNDKDRKLAEKEGIKFEKAGVTKDNYRELLTPYFKGPGRPFLVNVSVDVSSVDMITFCTEHKALYIDTVVEPWLGFYTDTNAPLAARTNYVLREELLELRRRKPGGPTAISCCGANPGMVSWFAKQALLNIANDLKLDYTEPKTREEWAALMQRAGVKGIHIAERDTQRAKSPQKVIGNFVNTWSVDGFISEGLQPAELGWGTHEKTMPATGRRHETGCDAAIYMTQPGIGTRVRSWTPTAQAQHGFLVTHNESISIADFFTVRQGDKVVYRPTVHYAYHPCDDAVLSIHEVAGGGWKAQTATTEWLKETPWKILDENEIEDGIDELGVLLFGHAKNAYWYGSQLSIEETRRLAPHQNATGLQVTSAIIAGMTWALENPEKGIIDADEIDFRRCLEVQMPYLGPVIGVYTDWTPLKHRNELFSEDVDTSDPWQFSNVLVTDGSYTGALSVQAPPRLKSVK